MVAWIGRCTAAVALCVAAVLSAGCEAMGTKEPIGDRIDMKDEKGDGAKEFQTMVSRVWVAEDNKEDDGIAYKFEATGLSGFVVTATDGQKVQQFQGFARRWNGLMLLQLAWVDQERQRPVLMCWAFKMEQDEKGVVTATLYKPEREAFAKERVGKDGKKVRLEFADQPANSRNFVVTSDEATIGAYLSNCKVEEMFEPTKMRVRGLTMDEFKKREITRKKGRGKSAGEAL